MTTEVKTTVPGNIWKVLVKVGDTVRQNDDLFIMEVMSEKIFTKLLSDKNYMYDILIGESFSIKYGKLLIRNYNHGVGSDPRKRSVQPAAPGDLRFYDSNSISN